MGFLSRRRAGVSRFILPPLAMLLIVLGSSFQIPVASALWRHTLGVSGSIQVGSLPGGKWDKSSLKFVGQGSLCDDGGVVFALVENGGRDMAGPAAWELYLHKDTLQAAGSIPALKSGEVYAITAHVVLPGTYKFTAYQRPGHPGKGVLRSEEIVFDPQACPAPAAAAPGLPAPVIDEESMPTLVPEPEAPAGAPQATPTPESVQDDAPPPEPVETEASEPGAPATVDAAGNPSATSEPGTPVGDPSISETPLPPAEISMPAPVETAEPEPSETPSPEPAAEQDQEPVPADLPAAEG